LREPGARRRAGARAHGETDLLNPVSVAARLPARDLARARAWYREKLGLQRGQYAGDRADFPSPSGRRV